MFKLCKTKKVDNLRHELTETIQKMTLQKEESMRQMEKLMERLGNSSRQVTPKETPRLGSFFF